jgi:hypothetical protein
VPILGLAEGNAGRSDHAVGRDVGTGKAALGEQQPIAVADDAAAGPSELAAEREEVVDARLTGRADGKPAGAREAIASR